MSPDPSVSRRTLFLGAAATALLVACGDGGDGDGGADGGDGDASDASGEPSGTAAAIGTYMLAQRFPQDVQEPGRLRLPISLARGGDGLLIDDGPDVLGAQVTDIDGTPIGSRITAVRRDIDPAPYYAFRPEIDEPGIYYLVVEGGPAEGAAFQVMEPGTVAVAGPGDALEPFDTPTSADARGVDPVCTRRPAACPFHDVTLTDALAAGRPVVYVIGTPAFCQTGTCAPALDAVIDLVDGYDGLVTVVHAEVFTDNTATVATPAVEQASIQFEPVLWVTDAGGVVVERLDAIWNGSELAEILDAVTA